MKIYSGYPGGITKISRDKDFYQTESLANIITVYLNQADVTGITYNLVLEFLRADGRKTVIYQEDPFAEGDDTTLTEDGVTYDIHNFTLTETQLAVAGTLAFTCYINIIQSGAIVKRGVLFNAISNVRKTVSYDENTIFVVEDDEDVPVVVADMKTAIETLGASKVNTSDIVDNLTSTATNKPLSANQGKVLKDAVDNRYTKTESDNTFAPKSNAIKHTGNQLQDYSGNNIYPELDNYQVTTTKIATNSVTLGKLHLDLQDILVKCATNYNVSSTPVAPFDDLNTLPKNSICTYAINASTQGVSNLPTGFTNGTIATYRTTNVGVQIAYYRGGKIALRTYYGSYESWAYNITTSTGDISASNLNSSLSNKLIMGVSNFSSLPSAPFNDFDTFTINSIVAFADNGHLVAHCPSGFRYGMVLTYSYSVASTIHETQIVTSNDGDMWIRYKYSTTWCSWKKAVTNFDKSALEYNPFSLSLFKNIAVIGDSYASGLLVDYDLELNENHYDCSWIQILARQYGITATNYSNNGVNAKTWFTTAHCYSDFQNDTAKDLYYVCLGINPETTDTGTTADIDLNDYSNNADTFYGNLGKIISMIKEKSPNGKIIVSTTPSNATKNADIIAIANYCSVPILRIDQDALISSSLYTTDFRSQGHPTLIGYSAYAKAYDRQTSKCIANNVSYFKYYKGTN